MTAVEAALGAVTRVDEIGFPEFTTKLVTDVFDALVASSINQQQAYVELLDAVAKSLSSYINDTKDDIGPEEILQFLSAAAPPADTDGEDDPEAGPLTAVAEGGSLSQEQADRLNAALETAPEAAVEGDNQVATASSSLTTEEVDTITEAAAIRLAQNKYTLLQNLVRQGLLRIVVESGVIESRLTFRTTALDTTTSANSSYNRRRFELRARARTGGFLSKWVKASASTTYSNVSVNVQSTRTTETTTLDATITGGVRLNFRSDFQPLES